MRYEGLRAEASASSQNTNRDLIRKIESHKIARAFSSPNPLASLLDPLRAAQRVLEMFRRAIPQGPGVVASATSPICTRISPRKHEDSRKSRSRHRLAG